MAWEVRVRLGGQERLIAVLREHRQEDVAEAIGVWQGSVSAWARADSVPRAGHRAAMAELYQIPIDAWDQALPSAYTLRVPSVVGYRGAEREGGDHDAAA